MFIGINNLRRMIDNATILAECENLVAIGETFKLHIRGHSMLPLLGRGRDNVIVRRTSIDEPLEVGRIVLFRAHDRHLVAHRIRRIEDDRITMQGDGNPVATELCSRRDIIGVIEAVERESGKVVSCTSAKWRRKERLWLSMPFVVRRYTLAVMRRWLNRKTKR